MNRLHFLLLSLALLLMQNTVVHAQGLLSRVRGYADYVPKTYSAPNTNTETNNTPNQVDEFRWNFGPEGGQVIAAGVVGVGLLATSPFWGPYQLFDAGFGTPGYFTPHPYSHAKSGFMMVSPYLQPSSEWAEGENGEMIPPLKNWTVRGQIENGNDFNGLNRLGGKLFLDGPYRVGGMLNWNYYQEQLGSGRTDWTMINDYHVTYRFTQSEWLILHAGAGLRQQLDPIKNQYGVNFLYHADIFPAKPVHLEGQFEVGSLGESFVLKWHAGIGLTYNHWELFAGYDFLRIHTVNLQGPFLGLRAWF